MSRFDLLAEHDAVEDAAQDTAKARRASENWLAEVGHRAKS